MVGLHNAKHGFTIFSFHPTHKEANNKTAHTGHKQRRTADGSIGGGRYCCHRLSYSFVNNVFNSGGTLLSSIRRRLSCHSLVISLHLPLSCGGAPPNPNDYDNSGENEEDYNDNKEDDDNDLAGNVADMSRHVGTT